MLITCQGLIGYSVQPTDIATEMKIMICIQNQQFLRQFKNTYLLQLYLFSRNQNLSVVDFPWSDSMTL